MHSFPAWRAMVRLATVFILSATAGCASSRPPEHPAKVSTKVELGKHSPEELSQRLMGFADAYASRINRTYEALEKRTSNPEIRDWARRKKLDNIRVAYGLATAPNPSVALLDLAASAQLVRMNIEKKIVPELLGDEGKDILEAHREGEAEIREIAGEVLTPEQLTELDGLVRRYWEKHRDYRYVAFSRVADLLPQKQRTDGISSVFDLLGLDPLAGLDPAAREMARSRLFAERAFFLVKRTPQLLSWQMEDLLSGQSEKLASELEKSLDRLLDTAFKRLLALILVILVGTPAVMILYRIIHRRLFAPRTTATGEG